MKTCYLVPLSAKPHECRYVFEPNFLNVTSIFFSQTGIACQRSSPSIATFLTTESPNLPSFNTTVVVWRSTRWQDKGFFLELANTAFPKVCGAMKMANMQTSYKTAGSFCYVSFRAFRHCPAQTTMNFSSWSHCFIQLTLSSLAAANKSCLIIQSKCMTDCGPNC